MLYLSVQIWFWVFLAAGIGVMVGLKLQQRQAALGAGEGSAEEVARLDRELTKARAETEIAQRQVDDLKGRITVSRVGRNHNRSRFDDSGLGRTGQ